MKSSEKTLVGLNKNFTKRRLGQLCDFTQGVQIASKDTINELRPNYIRYIYIRDLFTDNYPVYVKNEYPNKILSPDDIVMVNTGNTFGSVYKGKKGVLCNNAFKITIKNEVLDKDYLWVYLNSESKEHMINRLSNTSGQPHVGHKNVAKLEINLPPLPEQQKIAQILTIWDKAITTTERLIDSKTQQKKALMQQLLTGKKRLIDDKGIQFKDKFQTTILSNLVEINKSTLGNTTQNNFEFSYISLSDVITGRISKDLESYTYNSAPSRARRVVKTGDILLSTVRPNLKGFAKVDVEYNEYIASTGFAVLSAKETANSDYIYHYLFSCHLTGQIHNLVTGSNYPAINSSDVAELNINYPSLKEQQKIAQVLDKADKQIDLLTQQLNNLKREKKALMQQLLTGKIRVNV